MDKPHYKYVGSGNYLVTIPCTSKGGKPMEPVVVLMPKSQILEGIKIEDRMRREMAKFLLEPLKKMPEVGYRKSTGKFEVIKQ